MIKLDESGYKKAYALLKKVRINSLFARAVVEEHTSGEVYADDLSNPTTFYIVHPYGMSLLIGNNNNNDFNRAFKDYSLNKNNLRNSFEWMQAYPNDWNETLTQLYDNQLIELSDNKSELQSGIIELNTRVNFQFQLEKYLQFKKNIAPTKGVFLKTTEKEFNEMSGSVIPNKFWNSASDFLTKGAGFSCYIEGELACTAYSAFLIDKMLEIGIETVAKFRGKGLAQHTCSHLIDYCLENDLEPIWACRLDNVYSFRLAQKLGFEPIKQIPYYRLSR